MSSGTVEPGGRGTAVVTGAARGLGQAFAVALAQTGHTVALTDRESCAETIDLIHATAGVCIEVRGDAADPRTAALVADAVRDGCPPARVLVNNVGISPYAPFEETSVTMWHDVLRVNLDSMFHMTQAFLPALRAHDHARIVNLTSTVVWDAQATSMTAYATSKAAIVGFTRALASEVGVDGVTVNAIAPGIVLTPDIAERVPAERLEAYRQRQAIKRIAEPADLTRALLFLVDEASAMVTGTVLPVNAGRVWL